MRSSTQGKLSAIVQGDPESFADKVSDKYGIHYPWTSSDVEGDAGWKEHGEERKGSETMSCLGGYMSVYCWQGRHRK